MLTYVLASVAVTLGVLYTISPTVKADILAVINNIKAKMNKKN